MSCLAEGRNIYWFTAQQSLWSSIRLETLNRLCEEEPGLGGAIFYSFGIGLAGLRKSEENLRKTKFFFRFAWQSEADSLSFILSFESGSLRASWDRRMLFDNSARLGIFPNVLTRKIQFGYFHFLDKVILNNGEFDPGSGRTLAARLTHASRTPTSGSPGQ